MPNVGGKKYPYTKAGRAAAAKAKTAKKAVPNNKQPKPDASKPKKAVPSNKQPKPDASKPKKAVPSNKQPMTPALKKLFKKKK